ncbi:MAG: DMT family transporter [Bdellovibrionia bacterium]
MFDKLKGPLFIALAALLWATDSPFRAPLTQRIDPISIVLFEHVLGLLVLFVIAMIKDRAALLQMKFTDWVLAILVGAGGSALATFLFTAAFAHLNPSVVILLQKLQPIFVTLVAYVFLKERPEKNFYGWAAVALVAAVLLSMPYLQATTSLQGILSLSLESQGVIYALGAAALWGTATVCGKVLLKRHSPLVVTFWRYAFGVITLVAIANVSPIQHGVSWEILSSGVFKSLLYMSLISGLLSMLIYYRGLVQTPASVATFVELVYPVSAVLLNLWLLHATLSPLQACAGTALVFSVLRLSI